MNNKNQFDVIVVGGRIAGCAAAIEFAKNGLRVLVVEQARLPSDTLSTHFMNPRGMTYLGMLGVSDHILEHTKAFEYLDVVIDDFDLGGRVDIDKQRLRFESLHGSKNITLDHRYACIRRYFLDQVLMNKAISLGVHFLTECKVVDVIIEHDRAAGIVCTNKSSEQYSYLGKLVVGADGKKSTVAKILNIEKQEEKKTCTFACYTYFSGLTLPHGRLKKLYRCGYAAVPTNNDLTMVLVYGPASFYEDFKKNRSNNFIKTIALIDEDFCHDLMAKGTQVEPFYSTDDQSAFIRKTSKHQVPLIGDAAMFKDQCTASGMMHALRDGILLAEQLKPFFKGEIAKEIALRNFEELRYTDSYRYYEFTASQAEMNPLREDECELYEAISKSEAERNRFVSLYFDIVSVRDFFSQTNVQRLLSSIAHIPRAHNHIDLSKIFTHPYKNPGEEISLEYEQSCLDFAQVHGRQFEKRVHNYFAFYKRRQDSNTFQYSRTLHSFPGAKTELSDEYNRHIKGLNFASQDYLGLGQDSEVLQAIHHALERFGPHSAGSPMIIGNTMLSRELEEELSKLVSKKHVLLFPTGYAAGMGTILGLVKPHDHIVMDRLSHACLQQGANAATKKVHRYAHLDHDAARALLRNIRKTDARNAILLITEGLFSMDADSPNLNKFQELAFEFDATLLVDVAHDLGATGPGGTGQMGIQGMLGKIDLVMGSFSKTFATNGGFMATDSEALIQYVKMFSTPHLFSNALSPIQTAIALRAARIIGSPKGENLRQQLLGVVNVLRDELNRQGMRCMGITSPIVPVLIGSEKEARICHRLSTERNIANMILEYPVVPLGATRFRLQVMASHTKEDATVAAQVISQIIKDARL